MSVSMINNVAGVFGLTAQPDWHVEEFISGESSTTIAAGDAVKCTTVVGKSLQCTTGTASALQLTGVSITAVLAGKQGLCITKGRVNGLAKADYASPTVGDILTAPTATAGRLSALSVTSATQGQAIGVVTQTTNGVAGVTIGEFYLTKM